MNHVAVAQKQQKQKVSPKKQKQNDLVEDVKESSVVQHAYARLQLPLKQLSNKNKELNMNFPHEHSMMT